MSEAILEGKVTTKRTLQELVDRLVTGELSAVLQKESFIVNEVPGELVIAADEKMLAGVLKGLLHIVVSNAKNSCIRVAAKVYGDIVLVHVRDTRRSDNRTIMQRMEEIQTLAGKVGGCVTVCNQQEEAITLAFSFFNGIKAA